MKKGWIITLALILLGSISTYIVYNRLKTNARAEGGPYDDTLKPRLEMSHIDLTNISDEEVSLTIHLLIDNPLPVGFRANKVDYTVLIADTPVVTDAYAKPIQVKSSDSTLIALPAKLKLKTLKQVLQTLERKGIDSTTYAIRTTFALDVPILGERTFAVTSSHRLPTYHIPQIKVEDIDFGKLNLKSQDVAAKVAVTNKNKFPYNITDTRYTVTIDGKQIAEGYQPEPILIHAQSVTPVVFPVTGKPGKTLSVLPKMLFDKKHTPYTIAFSCKIIDKSGNLSFKNSKLVATIRGTLDDFKKKK